MLRMLKLEKEDIVTRRLGGVLGITPPGEADRFEIILSPEAAVELVRDIQQILKEDLPVDYPAYTKEVWTEAQVALGLSSTADRELQDALPEG